MTRQIAPYDECTQESRMTERVKSGLMRRGLETDYGGASEAPSDERDGTDRLHLRNTAPVLDPTTSTKTGTSYNGPVKRWKSYLQTNTRIRNGRKGATIFLWLR